jgi:pectate lyase
VCAARQFCNAGSCAAAATCPDDSAAFGWATQGGSTTGGGTASPTTVTSLSALNSAADGTTARVIVVSGTISGDVTIGSNKTIRGACGGTATIKGHIQIQGSKNIILRNLNIIGKNCSDASDCSSGDDAITIDESANHIFIDHCDISDGSDGNVDITHASDYITIAWTKFHYSTNRTGGHEFSNLIGHSASNGSEDSGHLRVTFSHDWWADHVDQRMPRVRFGQVHIFNSLYTALSNTYCIGVGTDANILLENSVFVGVKNPIDTGNVDPTAASVLESNGNLFTGGTWGTMSPVGSGNAFTPPYTYTLDTAASVQSRVKAGAGPI